MRIEIPYTFTAEVVPPRCRKPRRVGQTATISLTIHEVSRAEAPVAIRQLGDRGGLRRAYEYRWWRGRLWSRYQFQRVCHGRHETQTAAQFQRDPYPYGPGLPHESWRHNQSQAERRTELRGWAASVLFIDGKRYSRASEPRYVVMTFGLGGNHGLGWGTSLSTHSHYNPNIGRDRYFRVDQYADAVAEAARIAEARGDTKALPIEKQRPARFEVLIPEAVRLRPRRQHGKGDPFTNSVENMIQGVRDPQVAAFGLLALTSSAVGPAVRVFDNRRR